MQNYKRDEEFERYLKDFQPLPPDPLPSRTNTWVFPRFALFGAICTTAIVLLVATVILIHSRMPLPRAFRTERKPVRNAPAAPLTMQRANLLLSSDVPYRVVIEDLVSPIHSQVLPPRHQRAFAVLAEQKGLR